MGETIYSSSAITCPNCRAPWWLRAFHARDPKAREPKIPPCGECGESLGSVSLRAKVAAQGAGIFEYFLEPRDKTEPTGGNRRAR
jgi:hypothetical protein